MNKLQQLWQHLQLTESFAFVMLGIPVAVVVVFFYSLFQLQSLDKLVSMMGMYLLMGWFFTFVAFWFQAFICGLVVTSFRHYVTQKWHCLLGGLACVLILWLFIRQWALGILVPTFIAGVVCTYVLVYLENLKDQSTNESINK